MGYVYVTCQQVIETGQLAIVLTLIMQLPSQPMSVSGKIDQQ